MTTKLTILILALALTGCARVKAYQVHATESCESHHSAEECKPLVYPSCEPGNFGGTVCR